MADERFALPQIRVAIIILLDPVLRNDAAQLLVVPNNPSTTTV